MAHISSRLRRLTFHMRYAIAPLCILCWAAFDAGWPATVRAVLEVVCNGPGRYLYEATLALSFHVKVRAGLATALLGVVAAIATYDIVDARRKRILSSVVGRIAIRMWLLGFTTVIPHPLCQG